MSVEQRDAAEARFKFAGRASDGDAGILASGTGDVTTGLMVFFGKSERGEDADWLRWHAFDHMPEQYRVNGVRNGQRWISTPACRAARLAQADGFERSDLVVHYLFAEPGPQVVKTFSELGAALGAAERRPQARLRGGFSAGYDVTERRANPRSALGAYALPWYPARGVYLTLESSAPDEAARAATSASLERLVAVEGVAGAWRFEPASRELSPIKVRPGETATAYYLYDDPVVVAGRLGEAIAREWRTTGAQGLLAAPFEIVQPFDIERHLP